MADNNMVRLTGLWKNESKDGKTYLTGLLSPTSRLMVFPNTRKNSPKDPDYTAFLAPNIKKERQEDTGEEGWF